MKTVTNSLMYSAILMGIILLFLYSCTKENENPGIPKVTTADVDDITPISAHCGGSITSDGGTTITARGVCWSTETSPSISDNKTTDGTGTGDFTSTINGLTPNTTYYVRAYATNGNGTGYGETKSFKALQGNTFTDSRDGNIYLTVQIGTQVWMAENLRYLPSVNLPVESSITDSHYYVYDYNGTSVTEAKNSENYKTYGVLYNWPAAVNSCPQGWHLPSYAEWAQLEAFLGGDGVAGGKLKTTGNFEASSGLWYYPNSGATNESGFTAVPAGYINSGVFGGKNANTHFWSTEEGYNNTVWLKSLAHDRTSLGTLDYGKQYGFSVRCIKD